MESDNNRPINTNNYNSANGKLNASIKWLITRIYEGNDIPDHLKDLFYCDEKDNLQLLPVVAKCLTNGFFYKQAAAKILHNMSLVTQNVGSVLRALSVVGIEVRELDGSHVTEQLLSDEEPLKISAHLSLIDSLMMAHLKSIITIEKVVQAISAYTPVEKREEPLDCVDALLFWINKICYLVRDDVEKNEICLTTANNSDITIPEMEDLYEDLCDGTCICVILSFYHSHIVSLQSIRFNDPMSINDCRFNLNILKQFCENVLPWNPFHFEIEDVLFLHENLQPNVNVFLADLFNFFENFQKSVEKQQLIEVKSPISRRFSSIQGVPDLRKRSSQQLQSKINFFSQNPDKNDNSTTLPSVDSLITSRSDNLFRYSQIKNLPNYGENITNFSELQNVQENLLDQNSPINLNMLYNKNLSTEAKLQISELRRHWEMNKLMQNALIEEKRTQAGKDAFFRVMSKSINEEHLDLNEPKTLREEMLSAQVQDLQEKINNMKLRQSTNALHELQQSTNHNESLPCNHYVQPNVNIPMQNNISNYPYAASSNFSQPNNFTPQMANRPQSYFGQQNFDHANYALPQTTVFSTNMTPGSNFIGSSPYSTQTLSKFQNANISSQFPLQNLPNFVHSSPQQIPVANFSMINSPQTPMQLQSSISQPNALNLMHQQNSNNFTPQQNYYFSPHQYQNFMSSKINLAQPQFPQLNLSQMVEQSPCNMSYSESFATNNLHNHLDTQNVLSPQNTNQFYNDNNLSLSESNNNNAFRLHQSNASTSRLDPPLELNRNMTNWKLTYRTGDRPPRKSWSKTEFKSELNLPLPEKKNDNKKITEFDQKCKQNDENFSNFQTIKFNNLLDTASNKLKFLDDNENNVLKNKALNQSKNINTFLIDATNIEDGSELTAEMQAKRRALLINQIKRKEKIVALTEEKEQILLEKRQVELQKQEKAEQRKLERELRRQKLLDDYKRKKMEQELGDTISGSFSARISASSTTSLNRGHSQPPVPRPKSQSNVNLVNSRTLNRSTRAQSNVAEENSTPQIIVPSTAEPTLKLYAKHQPKSNRSLIMNALQYRVFPGAVSADQKNKVQCAIAQSDSKHFLVLFRDHKCQYRGMYTWDQISDTVYKIEGTGPKICRENSMVLMFKYDSGAKIFNKIPTKHLSATIDGFTIDEQFWQKTKIPHS